MGVTLTVRDALFLRVLGGLLSLSVAQTAAAQEGVEVYLGGVVGAAVLSADATSRATASTDGFTFSRYAPKNGPAVNLFAGAHVTDYVTFQANYRWNRNDVRSVSASATSAVDVFDDRLGRSTQHAAVGDVLLYFRERSSRFRSYLSAGVGAVWVTSDPVSDNGALGLDDSSVSFTDTIPVLRVAVGIDVEVGSRWQVRYSFSEGISPNPFTERLSPPGERGLMNFQNLVGLIYRF